MELTHTDKGGKASMVDICGKEVSVRTARARADIRMKKETLIKIKDNSIAKGDVLPCARIAGIAGAKKTWDLIPLCHNIPIEKISVDFEFSGEDLLTIETFAKCNYSTGIEMEALTAASVAALTVYDMCKAIDRSMVIERICLVSKSGGASGEYKRDE